MGGKGDIYGFTLKELASMRDAYSSFSKEALEAQRAIAKGITGIPIAEIKAAQEGIGAFLRQDMISYRKLMLDGFKLPVIEPIKLPDLSGIKLPNINGGFAEVIRQSLHQSIGDIGVEVASAISGIAKSMDILRDDYFKSLIPKVPEINFAHLSGISGVASLAAIGLEQRKVYEQIHASFAGMLTGAFKDALRVSGMNEAAFADVERLVNDRIDNLPPGRISAEGIFTLLLQIVGVLIAIGAWNTAVQQRDDANESSKTQAVQFTQLMESLQRIASNTEKLIPENDQNTYYVVERTVELRIKPSNHSAVISALSPNQKVRLIQINHQWIYIEYFDYLEGVPKNGWAMKKYLKRLSR